MNINSKEVKEILLDGEEYVAMVKVADIIDSISKLGNKDEELFCSSTGEMIGFDELSRLRMILSILTDQTIWEVRPDELKVNAFNHTCDACYEFIAGYGSHHDFSELCYKYDYDEDAITTFVEQNCYDKNSEGKSWYEISRDE